MNPDIVKDLTKSKLGLQIARAALGAGAGATLGIISPKRDVSDSALVGAGLGFLSTNPYAIRGALAGAMLSPEDRLLGALKGGLIAGPIATSIKSAFKPAAAAKQAVAINEKTAGKLTAAKEMMEKLVKNPSARRMAAGGLVGGALGGLSGGSAKSALIGAALGAGGSEGHSRFQELKRRQQLAEQAIKSEKNRKMIAATLGLGAVAGAPLIISSL